MNVVIYAAASRPDASPNYQLHHCRDYAAAEDWTVIAEHTDAHGEREGYHRAIEATHRCGLLLSEASLLPGAAMELLALLREVKRRRSRIITINGEIMDALNPAEGMRFAALAHYESVEMGLQRNLRPVAVQARVDHLRDPRKAPYGYVPDPAAGDALLPFEPEQIVLDELVQLRQRGYSPYQISRRLNLRRLFWRGDQHWDKRRVRSCLSREGA